MSRLFLGVGLDRDTRALIASYLEAHIGGDVPGRAVPPQNWHLTLRFLGSSCPDQADRVLHGLESAKLPGRFDVRWGGLGAFPREVRATVLWLGVGRGAAELSALAAACEEAAGAAGFAPEGRPFHPHLTLSRLRPPVDVSELVAGMPRLDAVMSVGEIVLFESHLGRGGARYEALERIAL